MSAWRSSATAWRRSVPEGRSGEVIWQGQEWRAQSSATSSESVAMRTSSSWGQAMAASKTQASMGRPAMVRRTLRESRGGAGGGGVTPRRVDLVPCNSAILVQIVVAKEFGFCPFPDLHNDDTDPPYEENGGG